MSGKAEQESNTSVPWKPHVAIHGTILLILATIGLLGWGWGLFVFYAFLLAIGAVVLVVFPVLFGMTLGALLEAGSRLTRALKCRVGLHNWWITVFADETVNQSCQEHGCPMHEPTTILGPAANRLYIQHNTPIGHLFHMHLEPTANPIVQKAFGGVECPACVSDPGTDPKDSERYCNTCGGSGLVMPSDKGWPDCWRISPSRPQSTM
jgi:hypothetical protein